MKQTAMLLLISLVLALSGPIMMLEEINIIGGTEACPGEFPYIVSLIDIRYGTNRHFCGGVIYSDSYILTAAHCVQNFKTSDLRVVAGEHDRSKDEGTEQTSDVVKISKHPNFNVNSLHNDIAVLKLSSKLQFDNFVKPIALSCPDTALPDTLSMMGWGSTSEESDLVNVLRKVTVPMVSKADCKEALKDQPFTVTSTHLCAGSDGKDACFYDDGGPLVSEMKVFGLASWSIGCGRPNMPGVYTKASSYKQWIEDTVAE